MTTWITSIPVPSAPGSELLAELRALEGGRVDLTLRDGSRLDDCQLVSTGRLWAKSVWILLGDSDLFLRVGEIVSVRAASGHTDPWP